EEATIQISLTGTAPFTFVYTDGENETTVTTEENLYEFTTTEFKTYTLVSLSDANCSGEVDGSATVSDGSDNIQVEIDTDDYACFGDVIDLALLGDTDGLTVKWSTEGKGTLENIDQITTSYTPAANETGVIVFYVELSNNCAIKTISKEVTIIEEIDASFSVSPEKDLFTNTQITFTPTNNNYDEYEWDFGDGSSSSAVISSTEYSEGGYYTVELLVNIAGCEGTGSTELEILSKDELYVPNAFNPTAQNTENQVVKVYGNNVDEYGFSFKIVNRWGKVMYQTNSFDEANRVGWDGVNNNNNEEQELTVFTYILKGRFIEGEPFERTGTVTQVK
ncbi:MAG: gliding motility-associated C-terminal domain-containing protein, partial [Cyclobacteriaceae bacterium]|nr:gliding motility-associated C-terminal domain-containing protein [Cyclobacteriaceae bacterium]